MMNGLADARFLFAQCSQLVVTLVGFGNGSDVRDSSRRVRKPDLLLRTHIGCKIRRSYMGSAAYQTAG